MDIKKRNKWSLAYHVQAVRFLSRFSSFISQKALKIKLKFQNFFIEQR